MNYTNDWWNFLRKERNEAREGILTFCTRDLPSEETEMIFFHNWMTGFVGNLSGRCVASVKISFRTSGAVSGVTMILSWKDHNKSLYICNDRVSILISFISISINLFESPAWHNQTKLVNIFNLIESELSCNNNWSGPNNPASGFSIS